MRNKLTRLFSDLNRNKIFKNLNFEEMNFLIVEPFLNFLKCLKDKFNNHLLFEKINGSIGKL